MREMREPGLDVATVRTMIRDGMSAAEIAQELDAERKQVLGVIRELGGVGAICKGVDRRRRRDAYRRTQMRPSEGLFGPPEGEPVCGNRSVEVMRRYRRQQTFGQIAAETGLPEGEVERIIAQFAFGVAPHA